MYRRARSARLNAARIYQTEHLGQNLNAATQGLFQEFLFRRNKTVLHQCRGQGFRHDLTSAGRDQKAEDVALVERVDRRLRVRNCRSE